MMSLFMSSFSSSPVRRTAEQDMERKVQEHKQELERLRQATKLDKERLVHDAKLKKEAAGVSGNKKRPLKLLCANVIITDACKYS